MSAIQVVVRPDRPERPSRALAPLLGLFDVVIDGVNVTARIGSAQAFAVLAELGHAVSSLASGRRRRSTLQLYAHDEAWELGLERDDQDVLVTVFRSGPSPEVAVHERRVTLDALREGVLAALEDPSGTAGTTGTVRTALRSARAALAASWPPAACPRTEHASITVVPDTAREISFGARASVRRSSGGPASSDSQLERADLHSLLAHGEIDVFVRGRTEHLGNGALFLVVERLLVLAEDVLEAWQRGRPMFRRFDVNGIRVGVRRAAGDAPLDVRVASRRLRERGEAVTFPGIGATAFAEAAVHVARSVGAAFVAHEPAQASNLRLISLLDAADDLRERLDDLQADDSMVNPEPESYRVFASSVRRSTGRGRWSQSGRMRFLPRWVAAVPNIDLRATFLCGRRLIIGSSRELASLDRTTGEIDWRVPAARAATIVTPSALARIAGDGSIGLHDLETGELRLTARITPRKAGGAAGAVVHVPGLPKLLVLSEGERRVTAIDLVSGEVRWRHTAKRPAAFRIRRAGRLLLVAGGDCALVALEAASGEVVWRLKNRTPFTGDMSVDRDDTFVLSGEVQSVGALHRLDPWTGSPKWSARLREHPAPNRPPLVTSEVVVVPTKDRRGVGAEAFARATGDPLWAHEPGFLSPTTAWLAVDDAILANSDAGTLICLDANGGRVRYNHVFARHVDADQPRRLEPVLRSGALFVPQHRVHVVRPRDGEIIGTIPSDLIPDLIRVDERCDVYVAEESGHLAAFGAAPRLCLVK